MFGVAILRSGRLPRGGAWLIIAFVLAKVGVIVATGVLRSSGAFTAT
jgi:hypothetical protein